MRILLYLISIIIITACAFMEPILNSTAAGTADAIQQYCEQTTEIYREDFRQRVNAKLPKNTYIYINCNKEKNSNETKTQNEQTQEPETVQENIWLTQ